LIWYPAVVLHLIGATHFYCGAVPPLGAAFFVRVVSGFQIQDKHPDQHQHKPQRLTEINGAFAPPPRGH